MIIEFEAEFMQLAPKPITTRQEIHDVTNRAGPKSTPCPKIGSARPRLAQPITIVTFFPF
jgi:hypothetical protein